MTESEIRQRGGASRDLNAARAAFDVGDADASRQAHEAKIHSTEQHAGCVVFSSLPLRSLNTSSSLLPVPSLLTHPMHASFATPHPLKR